MKHRCGHFLFTGLCMLLRVLWSNSACGQNFTVSGTVTDALSGEMILGATLYDQPAGQGTATNTYGFYSLTLPAGTYIFTVGSLGYQSLTDTIRLTENLVRDFRLSPAPCSSRRWW